MAPIWRKLRTEPLRQRSTLTRVVFPDFDRLLEMRPWFATGAYAAGPVTSGTTELTLVTVNIDAQTYNYEVECSSTVQAINTVAGDSFFSSIKLDGVTQAVTYNSHDAINRRRNYSLGSTPNVTVEAGNALAVTLHMKREGGTGIVTMDTPGSVTIRIWPVAD